MREPFDQKPSSGYGLRFAGMIADQPAGIMRSEHEQGTRMVFEYAAS